MARSRFARRALAFALAFGAIALGAIAPAPPAAAATDDGVVRKAMEEEMARSLSELRMGASPAPYYVRYTVLDNDRARVGARLGALVDDGRIVDRVARVNVRVGSPDEDNTNARDTSWGATAGVSTEDDHAALRRDFWLLTDQDYKRALEVLAKKKASHAIQADPKEKVPDFARLPGGEPHPSVKNHATVPTDADRAKLKGVVLALSRVFREFPTVNSGSVDAGLDLVRRRLLTSEKTWTDERRSHVQIQVHAETIAIDGQRLASGLTFSSTDVAGLPALDRMEADIRRLATNLADQRLAPAVEVGSATVLFEGPAAAQLAKLLLAAPLSGQPVPRSAGDSAPQDGSTSLADKLGLQVAPKWLTVVDDPTALGPGKRALFGAYDTDDEGVPAERVTLIDHGVVKTLLMSRTPRKEIPRSNGHGRGAFSIRATAANLFVTATGGLGRPELLAAAIRSAGPKGTVYIVQQLGEGSGIGRGQTLQARVAFRYKEGKEEVVRGLFLEGFTPKKLKKDLVAAGKDPVVLDDEISGLPMAVVTPPLLFEDVDVGKPNDKNRRPPLYQSPLATSPR